MKLVSAIVYGTPIPQGSTKAFMRPGARFPTVTADNRKTKPWRYDIVAAVRAQLPAGYRPSQAAVAVRAHYYLPRPKSLPRRVFAPIRKPDLDKLDRALLDALTAAGVWGDDSQVVAITARKAYAGSIEDPAGTAGVPRLEVDVLEYAYLGWGG